jgi:hypothetical protein
MGQARSHGTHAGPAVWAGRRYGILSTAAVVRERPCPARPSPGAGAPVAGQSR